MGRGCVFWFWNVTTKLQSVYFYKTLVSEFDILGPNGNLSVLRIWYRLKGKCFKIPVII